MLKPLPSSRWNYSTAAHLLNRAGFGGTPAEIEKLVQMGPAKAVNSFVDFDKIPEDYPRPLWADPDPSDYEQFTAMRRKQIEARRDARDLPEKEREELLERMEREGRRARQRVRRSQIEKTTELRGWWIRRMAITPRPLQEKLTLFWHGHFATSAQKVRDPYFMWLQNETFRTNSLGDWQTMLEDVTKDPAMLFWLDQAQSNRRKPNENYAREVMELFALGEGNYSERDILEAARGLTGLTIDRAKQEPVYRSVLHDPGTKTLLGETGRHNPSDVIRIIANHPKSAPFIVTKIWSFFANENVKPEVVDALTVEFRKAGGSFRALLQTMFRCEEFYAKDNLRTQIKSPVQWLVGSARMLEAEVPPGEVGSRMLASLGQDLFAPPNVKGWDGGTAWINTNTLMSRYNLAGFLVSGKADAQGLVPQRFPDNARMMMQQRMDQVIRTITALDIEKLIDRKDLGNHAKLVATLEKRLLQDKLKEQQRGSLNEFLKGKDKLDREDVLQLVRLIMSTPQYQLT
ncbi:MAG: hypothetical protein CMI31_07660 [Opitutae bacterium]|nr:hypothetical protein [Opitutae bacterium]